MDVSAGDRLVLESEKVGQPPRAGTVEAVLSEEPLRLRVRWENGSVTTLSPEAGAARIEPAGERLGATAGA